MEGEKQMSLKKECMDMIHLIVDPLQEKDEYAYYDIEMDSIRDICQVTGEDVTYSDCSLCDKYSNECPYKKTVKVDISFWDGNDYQYNFVFGNNRTECYGVCRIKNRKQLMAKMVDMKKELEKYKDYYSEFGERYNDYIDYAEKFAQEVQEEYFLLFGRISTNILPIIFHTDYDKHDGIIEYNKSGNLIISGKQSAINIYCCIEDIEETKCAIRHEVLHYMLYIAGLKHDDASAIFHHLCEVFDARAYKKMGNDEKKLYERLKNALSKLEIIFKTDFSEENDIHYNSGYLSMLVAIGCNNDNQYFKNTCQLGMQLLEQLELLDKKTA